MTLTFKMVSFLVVIGVFVLGFCAWSLSTSVGKISINGTELSVRIAEHVLAQKKGLGGYTEESLQEDGMLFVFSDDEVRTFWMKGMKMDLDILWIRDGKIVAIDRTVQAPYSRADEPERATSSPLLVDMVLELPAGKAEEYGLLEGMRVGVEGYE
jgi:uncharacterized protein